MARIKRYKKGDLIFYNGKMLYFEKYDSSGNLIFSEPRAFDNYKIRKLTLNKIALYGSDF